jgi:hypothetical protein
MIVLDHKPVEILTHEIILKKRHGPRARGRSAMRTS